MLKKNVKEFGVLAMSLILILGLNLEMTSAATAKDKQEGEVNGDMTISEGAQPYVETEQDILKAKQKLRSNPRRLTRSSYTIDVKMDVPVYTQINGYYCGPATVKEVLQYYNGTSSSQKTYAKELGTTKDGTDMTKIPDVLNNHENKNNYLYNQFDSRSDWDRYVKFDMENNYPTVIDINSSKCKFWKYKTTGHYMCISGYDDSGSTTYAYVADPHNRYSGTYEYNADYVYEVNNDHWRHAVIW